MGTPLKKRVVRDHFADTAAQENKEKQLTKSKARRERLKAKAMQGTKTNEDVQATLMQHAEILQQLFVGFKAHDEVLRNLHTMIEILEKAAHRQNDRINKSIADLNLQLAAMKKATLDLDSEEELEWAEMQQAVDKEVKPLQDKVAKFKRFSFLHTCDTCKASFTCGCVNKPPYSRNLTGCYPGMKEKYCLECWRRKCSENVVELENQLKAVALSKWQPPYD
jgi:DNA repair exonuclease SbcCD ATPase subunit